MKYLLSFTLSLSIIITLLPHNALAIEDPRSRPNNKFGIHILFDTELQDAARLINSRGGDWGYVTIPIQVGDRDLTKWQNFMDQARKSHVIPIIRLATEGDYFNTKAWRKATYADVVDFANFLDSLNWPTKNRYVVVFNEVNRGDEWGGNVNPEEYAQILSYAVTVFKSKNQDFFILSAGLDNAAPNQGTDYMNEYNYLRTMNLGVPGIFNQIDGFSSHSYPNPGFAQPPSDISMTGISSFKYEGDLMNSLSNKTLPVFITETGWSANVLSDSIRAAYYTDAFAHYWTDVNVIAVTPFLLHADAGPFNMFGFFKQDGSESAQYKSISDIVKIKGTPETSPLLQEVLAAENKMGADLPTRSFQPSRAAVPVVALSSVMKQYFKWMLHL